MPANTPNGFPYVLPADNVADYPVTSQGLATRLDAGVPYAVCWGLAAFSVGTLAQYTRAVVFPVGLFSQTPVIVFGKGQTGAKRLPAHGGITKDGFTIYAQTADASTGGAAITLAVSWLALQATPTSGPTPGITTHAQDVDLSLEDDPDAMRALLEAQAAAGGVLLG